MGQRASKIAVSRHEDQYGPRSLSTQGQFNALQMEYIKLLTSGGCEGMDKAKSNIWVTTAMPATSGWRDENSSTTTPNSEDIINVTLPNDRAQSDFANHFSLRTEQILRDKKQRNFPVDFTNET